MGSVKRCYVIAAAALGALATLAGCSGWFFAEREPWRHEAEVQCLTAGPVGEGPGIVRLDAIRGPGVCGADFPLKVSALGESAPLPFADDPRPPASVPSAPPSWPISPPKRTSTAQDIPAASPTRRAMPRQPSPSGPPAGVEAGSPRADFSPVLYERRRLLSPDRIASEVAQSPVAIAPPATLACPIVSELDRWISSAVQPAALRWLGSPVAEIRQISSYSCRGMNGSFYAPISEHAFGNALDIAAFTLTDGRTITVKGGWHGLPEEQAFLRDVQAAACAQFSTVLAPGSNAYHSDHIHVDLMRRSSDARICSPAAVSGEEIAARAGWRSHARRARDPLATGALPPRQRQHKPKRLDRHDQLPAPALPVARPGEDGAE
jgi:hypothetical protein